jgi:hypothetical protein
VVLHQLKQDLTAILTYVAITVCFVLLLALVPCIVASIVILCALSLGYDMSFWVVFPHFVVVFLLMLLISDRELK